MFGLDYTVSLELQRHFYAHPQEGPAISRSLLWWSLHSTVHGLVPGGHGEASMTHKEVVPGFI